MTENEAIGKAKLMEDILIHNRDLLKNGERNDDTINILIASYVQGLDWSHGFKIIVDNAELFFSDPLEEEVARNVMSDTYEEFVHDDVDRPYSRLEWVENIIENNPNNWKEILISKLM